MSSSNVDNLQVDVCIVGYGAIGKAAALALSRRGLRVAILAPAAPIVAAPAVQGDDWDVRVFALNHVAHRLLSGLKVWDAMRLERVQAVSAMKIMDVASNEVADTTLSFDAYAAHTDELAWIVEDRNLNQALDQALQFAQHIVRLDGMAQSLNVEGDCAKVVLNNGCIVSADLVLGADGANSWVRGQSDMDVTYRSYGQRAVVCNFTCEKPHFGVAHQWFAGEDGIIALLPLPGNQVSLVWSAPEPLAGELMRAPLNSLADRLSVYGNAVLGRLSPHQPEKVAAFPLQFLRPHSMIAQRVALIGDAAHVVHPMAGQGMNLGFGDIDSLLKVLDEKESYRSCGDERILKRYQRARREAVSMMQFTTDGLTRLFASDLEPLKIGRKIGMNLLNRMPVIKRKLIAQAMGR